MVHCAAVGCRNNSKAPAPSTGSPGNSKITFHVFPKDPELRSVWVKNVSRADWVPHSRSVLCSEHFDPDSINGKGKIRRLNKDTVPTVFEGYPSYMRRIKRPVARSARTRPPSDEPPIIDSMSLKLEVDDADYPCPFTYSEAAAARRFKAECGRLEPETEAFSATDDDVSARSRRRRRRKRSGDDDDDDEVALLDHAYAHAPSRDQLAAQVDQLRKRNRQLSFRVKRLGERNRAMERRVEAAAAKLKDRSRRQVAVAPSSAVLDCLSSSAKASDGSKYPPVVQQFAMSLACHSTAAYEYVRQSFGKCLPDVRTIRRWCGSRGVAPGSSEAAVAKQEPDEAADFLTNLMLT